MICAGIDAGSRTIKVVLLDGRTRDVLGSGVTDQGVEQEALALGLLQRVLHGAGLERSAVSRIVSTGYGLHAIGAADETITEITMAAYIFLER